ncbi:hypothetical protein ACHAW6_007705 [Cyclotella cf. meneghiniana]
MSKIMWNSVISTPNTRFATADLKLFYLTAPMDHYKYMHMPIKIIPEHFIEQYNLQNKVKNGYIYMEICHAIYGLPQAGILANKLLKQRLAKYGYYEVAYTPGLWKHILRPISFTLVVDDFGIKYVREVHTEHFLNALKEHYTLDIDWAGKLYCGISLNGITRTKLLISPCQDILKNYSKDTIMNANAPAQPVSMRAKKTWHGCPTSSPNR